MFGNQILDGDLPPGIYERQPDGTLVPSRKVFTNDPPRPIHVAEDGTITNVTESDVSYLRDVALEHYEAKTGHSLTTKKGILARFREMCYRAAESVMEKK